MKFPTEKRPIFAVFLLIAIAGALAADFRLQSLSVFMNVNQDGSVNVEENLALAMNGSSTQLYRDTRSAYSDLATWQNRTGLSEMRHHVSRAAADITNLRVLPQAISSCNPYVDLCLATVTLDYTVIATSENGSGLVEVSYYKPRTARYSIQQDALSFDQTKTGDLLLPPSTNITISIPLEAEKIHFSSVPQNLQGNGADFRYDQTSSTRYYTGTQRIFGWRGDTLSNFQFTYEIEFPLETEVVQFFQSSQNSVISLFLGPEGLAALILIAAGAASVYYFNRLGK